MQRSNTTKEPTTPSITAAQIAAGELGDLGKQIAAHLKKARDYETRAEAKAGTELRKADDNFTSATRLLAEAKAKCNAGGFKAFKAKYAPDLSRPYLYELLRIGRGETTLEDVRSANAKRAKKSRAKRKTTSKLSVTGRASQTPADKPITAKTVSASSKTEQLVKQPAASAPEGDDGKQLHVDFHIAHENDEAQAGAATPLDIPLGGGLGAVTDGANATGEHVLETGDKVETDASDASIDTGAPDENASASADKNAAGAPDASSETGAPVLVKDAAGEPAPDVLQAKYDHHICGLREVMIEGVEPNRFAATTVSGADLRELVRFLSKNPRMLTDFMPADGSLPEPLRRAAS